MKIRCSRGRTFVKVAVVGPGVAGLAFGIRIGDKDIVSNNFEFAVMGPGVVGFAFGDRFDEEKYGT